MPGSRKVLLLIMDGWGWREETEANAVRLANTPNVDRLWDTYPHTLIQASGPWVGLPDGQMGNSEVGHLNIGAGRVVYQDIVRIDRAIQDGSFFREQALCDAMDGVRADGTLHLMGLLSDGGVHSHINHLRALIRMAHDRGVRDVCVHAILDGRDTAPHGGAGYIAALEEFMARTGTGAIASVIGRYFAMDRDRRWERTRKAYDLFTRGQGSAATSAVDAVRASYAAGVTDEFVEPVVIVRDGSPRGLIRDGDAVLLFNFRADRARQITHAFTDAAFDGFERAVFPKVHYVCMTRYYEDDFHLPVVFPAESRTDILVDTAAASGKKTLRLAETEKYAHVTYFFNGGEEHEFSGEKRVLIPSPKVATYDLQPEMSAAAVCDALVDALRSGEFDYVVCNFANPDMVGHTGVLAAAITACETVDGCVGRVIDAIDLNRYAVIIIADHGNAELMVDPVTGGPHTAHTTNPVPCILVDPAYHGKLIADGSLRDIAPTILAYLGVERPAAMTGRDLRAETA
ncbi:MAG TPA: 2,3-bisphosphoglycerate-independent phosphoglycerate mutase [Candidatus Krumholzibacteria bacterium]|nr:2,3-bisphosphoglycerate-independent phosphoglycerate mutase [Candidatus Krumholzibacteria bacterium]